jgi:hypothetical protein
VLNRLPLTCAAAVKMVSGLRWEELAVELAALQAAEQNAAQPTVAGLRLAPSSAPLAVHSPLLDQHLFPSAREATSRAAVTSSRRFRARQSL